MHCFCTPPPPPTQFPPPIVGYLPPPGHHPCWWPCPLPGGGWGAVVLVSPQGCASSRAVRGAGGALMLADARAHQKHAVASSRGHGTRQGHLPRPPAHGHPGVAPEAPVYRPAGDPGCPRWPQGDIVSGCRGCGLMLCRRETGRDVAPQKTPLSSRPGQHHPRGTGKEGKERPVPN